MTDRELLEAAAKAAGIKLIDRAMRADGYIINGAKYWNPLADDGDAFRLMVKLQIQVTPGTYNKDEFWACGPFQVKREFYSYQQDENAATRRAIVLAAAAMVEPPVLGAA